MLPSMACSSRISNKVAVRLSPDLCQHTHVTAVEVPGRILPFSLCSKLVRQRVYILTYENSMSECDEKSTGNTKLRLE